LAESLLTALCFGNKPTIELKQKAIITATAKRMLPCLETERGICKEVNQALRALLSARLLTNLFRMLLCRNLKLSPPQKV
jgi:hypothetical protein